jgi:Zinc knuckle
MLAKQSVAHARVDFDTALTAAEQNEYYELAKEVCQATAFLSQSDKKRYGELLSELENDYTKGQSSYPTTLVKAYQYLNEYKVRTVVRVPTATSIDNAVAFTQESSTTSKNLKGYEPWMDDKTCYNCQETGHISPICPHPKRDDDSGDETEDDKKKKAATPKTKTAKDKASKKEESREGQGQEDQLRDARTRRLRRGIRQ